VGAALITTTLDRARDLGFRAVLLHGNPDYYHRFGFVAATGFGIATPDGANDPQFMAQPLYDGALNGVSGRFIDDPLFESLNLFEAEVFEASLA
jgi:predicted N-acetyltransferase YhbS